MLTQYFRSDRQQRRGSVVALFDKSGTSLGPWRERGQQCTTVKGRTDTALRRLAEVENVSLVLAFPRCTQLSPAGARWWRRKAALDPDFQTREMDELRRLEAGLRALRVAFVIVLPCSAQIRSCFSSKSFTTSPHHFGGYLPHGPSPHYPDIVPERDAYQKRLLVVHHLLPVPQRKTVQAHFETRRGKRVSPLFAQRTRRHIAARKLPPLGLLRAFCRVN